MMNITRSGRDKDFKKMCTTGSTGEACGPGSYNVSGDFKQPNSRVTAFAYTTWMYTTHFLTCSEIAGGTCSQNCPLLVKILSILLAKSLDLYLLYKIREVRLVNTSRQPGSEASLYWYSALLKWLFWQHLTASCILRFARYGTLLSARVRWVMTLKVLGFSFKLS